MSMSRHRSAQADRKSFGRGLNGPGLFAPSRRGGGAPTETDPLAVGFTVSFTPRSLMFPCGYLVDGISGCGITGGTYSPEVELFLCGPHAGRVKANREGSRGLGELEARMATPDLPHSAGQTYAIVLPNGLVKIGAAGVGGKSVPTDKALVDRWKKLSKAYHGKVEVVSVRDGGYSREAILHYRLRGSRVIASGGETFRPTPEVIEAVMDGAMTPEGEEALRKFENWATPERVAA